MIKNLLASLALVLSTAATQAHADEIPTTEQPPEEEAKSKKKTTSCADCPSDTICLRDGAACIPKANTTADATAAIQSLNPATKSQYYLCS
jgi:hypothetical protein